MVMAKQRSMYDNGILGFYGLGLGIAFGFLLIFLGGTEVAWINNLLIGLNCVGQIFLRLLKMIVVPLVFCCITNAIVGLEDMTQLRTVGVKTFAYFFITSCGFGVIAIAVAKIIKPGSFFTLEEFAKAKFEGTAANFTDAIIDFFPQNIFQSMTNTSLLQIIIFCVFFGIAILSLGDKGKALAKGFHELELAMFKIIGYVMNFLPIGVFCLISYTIAFYGPRVIGGLMIFVVCDWVAPLIGIFTIDLFLLTFVAKVNFFKFMYLFKEAVIIALATCSSTTTLPVSTTTAKQKIGVPAYIADFSIPLGSTANMNGTCGFFIIITIFTCQLMNVDLSIPQYVLLVIESCLLAISCSTVPNTGIVIAITVLTSFNLPLDAIALVVGVYKFCDMAHTPTNCIGDWVTATCVAASQGELDRSVCQCSLVK